MSLDKFVMRGFTASTGNSTGQWVQKVPGIGESATVNKPQEPGAERSSFVLGGNPLGKKTYQTQSGIKDPTLDRDYGLRQHDIRTQGTALRRNAPKSCFGGGAETSDSTPDYFKLVMFLFAVVLVLVFALASFAGPDYRRRSAVPTEEQGERVKYAPVTQGAFASWDRN